MEKLKNILLSKRFILISSGVIILLIIWWILYKPVTTWIKLSIIDRTVERKEMKIERLTDEIDDCSRTIKSHQDSIWELNNQIEQLWKAKLDIVWLDIF